MRRGNWPASPSPLTCAYSSVADTDRLAPMKSRASAMASASILAVPFIINAATRSAAPSASAGSKADPAPRMTIRKLTSGRSAFLRK